MSINIDNGGDVLPDWVADVEDQQEEQQEASMNHNQSQNSTRANQSSRGADAPTSDPTSCSAPTEEKKWDFHGMIKRDGRLLLITFAIIILMNIPFVKWLLYPFTIFSTWVHELCHGLSAILVGGMIQKLLIFPDTSGLAYTSIPGGTGKRAFVASSGYQGTAVVGCLLLLFRRTKRGPRTGIMTVGVTMLVSTAIWVRNAFGFVIVALLGVILGVCGWKLPSARMRDVYTCVAVTCTLNAITSVHDLFGSQMYVNGQPSSTDAHTMADTVGGPYWLWAILWLFFALLMTLIGLVFAVPGPDECADFKCCGVCVDFGVFDVCNKRRQSSSSTE